MSPPGVVWVVLVLEHYTTIPIRVMGTFIPGFCGAGYPEPGPLRGGKVFSLAVLLGCIQRETGVGLLPAER